MKKTTLLLSLLLWSVALFAQPAISGTDKILLEGTSSIYKQTASALATYVKAPDVITPSQITVNQNDFNPTGWSTATLVRLDWDNTGKVITGLTAFTGEKTLVNIGSSYGIIAAEHPSSTVSNRVAGSHDYIIPPGEAITVVYDATTSRSRVVSETFRPDHLGATTKGMYVNIPTPSATAADNAYAAFTTSGSGAAVTTVDPGASFPRGLAMETGTTSTGACGISTLKDGHAFRWGDGHIVGFATVYIPVLSTSGQRFTANFAVSLINGTSADLPNRSSVGIKYTDNVNTGKWLLYSVDHGTTEGSTDSGVTVSANSVYVLMVVIDKALSEARYFVNGTYVGRMTTNMPTATISANVRCNIVASVGTTTKKFVMTNMGFQFIQN